MVPVYNEAENLRTLASRIVEGMESVDKSYEIILVDDGSSDGSTHLLKQLSSELDNLVVVVFRRNYGQTAAIAAGFRKARGKLVVTMDADLQNDPGDIPRLVHELEDGGPDGNGFDMVCGWRKNRKDNVLLRNLPSRVANSLIRRATGVQVHDTGCSLKAFRSWVVDSLELYGELHRYLPMLAAMNGARISEVEVKHSPRLAGSSKYSALGRIPRVLADLITILYLSRYRDRPMHLFGTLGLAFLGGGFATAFLGIPLVWSGCLAGASSVIRQVWFLLWMIQAGISLVAMGLILDCAMRLYYSTGNGTFFQIKEEYRGNT